MDPGVDQTLVVSQNWAETVFFCQAVPQEGCQLWVVWRMAVSAPGGTKLPIP